MRDPKEQHAKPKSDIEISQTAKMRPIVDVAKEKLGIDGMDLDPYGHYKAKVSLDCIRKLKDIHTATHPGAKLKAKTRGSRRPALPHLRDRCRESSGNAGSRPPSPTRFPVAS